MKQGQLTRGFTGFSRSVRTVFVALSALLALAPVAASQGAPPADPAGSGVHPDPEREQRWAALRQARVSCEDSIREATLMLAAGSAGTGASNGPSNRERTRANEDKASGQAREPRALKTARDGRTPRVVAAGLVEATGAGCRSNADCRFGRVCVDTRCEERNGRGTCGKDVDCPDDQVCAATGRCERPGAWTGVAVAPPDIPDCRSRCEQERRQCRVDAATELNQCLRAITGEAVYRDCACPTWPAAKPECRQVCETAFEQGDRCASAFAPRKDTCVTAAPSCKDCR